MIWIVFFAVQGSVSQVTMKSSWRSRAFKSNSGSRSMTGFTVLFFLVFRSGIRENSRGNMIRVSMRKIFRTGCEGGELRPGGQIFV
jgi:hypothetical protein